MNPVVVENIRKRHKRKTKQFADDLKNEKPQIRDAFDALQKLTPQEIERAYQYTQRFQALIQEQERLEPHRLEPPRETIEGGAPFGWIEYWIEDCQPNPSRNLSRILYKQCKECGQALTQKRSKSFCSFDCAESYRKWRDNVRDVSRAKDKSSKEIYIREKAIEKYRKMERPQLVTVSERAWKIACQLMGERYSFIPPENVLQYTAQQFKLAEWLLKHYVQRRVLETLNMPNLLIKPDGVYQYQDPTILYRHELPL